MTPEELAKLDAIEAKEGHSCMSGETYPQRYVDALNAEIRNLKRELTAITAERDALRDDKRSGIYCASKVKHAAKWRALRDSGVKVTATWIDEADEGQTASYEELAQRCIAEVSRSAAVVLYCEQNEVLKGALLEVGAALAFGIPVYAAGHCESISRVFVEHPLWHQHSILDAAIDLARKEKP